MALMYADLDAASALAQQLTMLAAQGQQSTILRGVVSSVRMSETPGMIDTVVTPFHWAICRPGLRTSTARAYLGQCAHAAGTGRAHLRTIRHCSRRAGLSGDRPLLACK